ncbi:MAG: AAA family ATPase [Cyanobacteria bacterium MAG CAR1_bin_15]|nr:AAA family ATPase [Cyanobacteria bacterium MAG CAR1_bin_15]
MRIESFAVRDFRKLTGEVSVKDLQPGITVIAGDNEEGKSTLLRALQSGFFDRHNLSGKGRDQMMPFGAHGVSPRVDVVFQIAGTRYRLSKGFGRNAAAKLEGDGDRWEGEAAEDRLRLLLGFSRPGRGAASEEHRGLAGLLWVEQGRAFQSLGMNQDSQAVLREAIEDEVGQVLGGERGRRLLNRVEKRNAEYFTRTGRERDGLSGPRQRVEELEKELGNLEGELQTYDDQVNRLGKLQERLARYERDGVLDRAREEAENGNAAVRQLEAVEGRLDTARAQMEQANSAKDLAARAREDRRTLAEEVAEADRQARETAGILNDLEPDYGDAKRSLAEAEERLATCNRGLDRTNGIWEVARRTLQQASLADELQKLDRQFHRAQSLNERIERKRKEMARHPVNEDHLDQLQDLRQQQIRLESALEAAAATLVFSPEGQQGVSLDGQPVDVGQPVRVTRNSVFHLHGFGGLDVTPGGQDLARLRTDLNALESQLSTMLCRLDVVDLVSAEAAFRAKKDLEAQVENLRGEIRGVAPQGLAVLETTVQERRARLAVLAGSDRGNPPDMEAAQSAEQAALGDRKEADRAAEQAMGERDEARHVHDQLLKRRIHADAERRQKAEMAATRQAVLKGARRTVADARLAEQAEQKARLLAECRSACEAVRAECDAMNPDALRMEQQRAEQAYEALQQRINANEREERDLAVELRIRGQRGLAEELEQKKGELDVARRDLERVEADAKAWKLLLETLRDAEREAKETFLGPVRERLQPYLRMIFPETELRLNEDDLEIVSLHRGGVEEPFANLSIGAREQVAVLTRLALADLLREKGRPVVLILDDPLVNSDDERFRRMEWALRKAAESSLQIMILTCHEARYETLGAKIIRLADCRDG